MVLSLKIDLCHPDNPSGLDYSNFFKLDAHPNKKNKEQPYFPFPKTKIQELKFVGEEDEGPKEKGDSGMAEIKKKERAIIAFL